MTDIIQKVYSVTVNDNVFTVSVGEGDPINVDVLMPGAVGNGLVAGGATGTVLTKSSAADYDATWEEPAVKSVFARTGSVVAVAGDYAASQVTNDSGVTGVNVDDALDTLGAASHVHANQAQLDLVTDGDHDVRTDNPHGVTSTQVLPTQTGNGGKFLTTNGSIASWETVVGGVTSVFGRTGAVVAALHDYDASQIDNDSSVSGATVDVALNNLGAYSHQHLNTAELALITDGDHDVRTDNPHGVTKTQVGLGNVTNDSQLKRSGSDFASFPPLACSGEDRILLEDGNLNFKFYNILSNLPISTAVSLALGGKADTADVQFWLTQKAEVSHTHTYSQITDFATGVVLNSPVWSVFGRTGAVAAAASDYDASQIDNDSSVTGAFVKDALNTLGSDSHTHLNKAQLDLVTDGDHDVRTDNPHGVTKAQVGLTNVTDALQLVAANNLSDVAVQQTALNNLTAVSGATAEHVLTKDTGTGNAIWKAASGGVTSVFGRTGAVAAAANDYTWAQIDKTTSSLADIATRSHTALSDIGTNTHAQIDSHISSTSNPHGVDETDILPAQASHSGEFLTTNGSVSSWAVAPVVSAFGRTGAVTAATNDYTWAQIDKTTSSLADITTRSHTALSDIGSNTHAQIDTHLGLTNAHIDWTGATSDFLTSGTATIQDNVAGTSRTALLVDSNLDYTGVVSGVTHVGIDADMDITFASGSLATGTVCGYRQRLNVVDNGALFAGIAYCLVDIRADLGGTSAGTDPLFYYKAANCISTQGFANGAMRIDVEGGTGTVIAMYSSAKSTGAGNSLGYNGYAVGVTSSTGYLIGVQGQVVSVNGATHSYICAVNGYVQMLGTTPAVDKRMSFRGNAHILLTDGSLVVTKSSVLTPNAVTTTHLNFLTDEGDGYFEGNLEVDGEAFLDGNESHSVTEVTSDSIGATTYVLVDATSGALDQTLPSPTGRKGRMYVIKKIDSSANAVTVKGTIDGSTDYSLASQNDVVRLICDGTEWWTV